MTNFFELSEQIPKLLEQLKPETQPKWGNLIAQQMVEHLGMSLVFFKNYTEPQLRSSAEKLAAMRKFLYSDAPMPRGIENPMLPKDAKPNLRFATLDEAKEKLLGAVEKFKQHFEENPEARYVHPYIGELNKKEWEMISYKHIVHHFTQFGLLEEK